MDIDLHIHTNRYSGCSNIDPAKLLKKARAVGLDGIALTEHGIRWSDDQIEQLRRASGVQDLLIIPGQEVACYWRHGRFQGEFLVFGYPKSLGSSRSAEEVIELVHAEGGVVVAAHPFKKFRHGDEGYYGAGKQLYDFKVDGLEVEHPDYDGEARAQAAEYERWRGKGLVGDEEYEEVLAEARECEARTGAAILDRLLWALEVRSVAGDPRWGEVP